MKHDRGDAEVVLNWSRGGLQFQTGPQEGIPKKMTSEQ